MRSFLQRSASPPDLSGIVPDMEGEIAGMDIRKRDTHAG